MARQRKRAAKRAAPEAKTEGQATVKAYHGLAQPSKHGSSMDRLRRALNLSPRCPADQVLSDAATMLERRGTE